MKTAALALLSAWGCVLQLALANTPKKRYPVSKVVTLLRDMQKELEKEAENDEEVYEKLDCWCKTNDRQKSLALQEAEARIKELGTTIEISSADSARLKQEIKAHEEDLAKSQESLNTATALREKQAAEFSGEEKDMLQSIQALDSAITVLAKHHKGAAFLDSGALSHVLDVMRNELAQHSQLFMGVITPRQRRLVMALPQQEPYLERRATFRQSYSPQSGEIFGILKQMKETFESNLSETQKEELSNRNEYEALKAAKEDEISATTKALEQKKIQLSEADEKNAQAKQDLEDTQNSMTADDKFLLDVKDKCAAADQEYDMRKKLRDEEMQAVSEAIAILSSDDAHDLFSRTFNPAFIQVHRVKRIQRGGRGSGAAASLLAVAASRANDPRFAALAVAAAKDPLEKVKQAIDQLIAELKAEKELEITTRDECITREHEYQESTERFEREKADAESKAATLKGEIGELESTMKTLTQEISDLELQIERKGEDRSIEKREFQETLADQRATQDLLKKALSVLRAVYKKKEVNHEAPVALLSRARRAEPAPPGFETYGANRASGGVVGLLEQILADAKQMQAEVTRDEKDAEKEYEDFVADTTAAIESKRTAMVNKSETKAKAEQDLISAEDDIRDNMKELETLVNTKQAIDMECSFLLKNFDIRQEARDEEIEALQEGKAILMGMKLE